MPVGQMGDAHRALGLVDVLAARALRAIDVDAQILVVDLDVDVFGLGQHRDRRRRGMDASARFRHRNALYAMHAALEFELGVDARAVHFQRRVLDAAEIALGAVHDFGLPALKLAIALIHLEQIGREQRGLVAAGAGADFDDGRR